MSETSSDDPRTRRIFLNADALFGLANNVIASTWNGSMSYGGVPGGCKVNFAPMAGSVSFNVNEYWHYDDDTPVGERKYDLYSVALQEMLRDLGVTLSEQLPRDERSGLSSNDLAALQANGWTIVTEPSALILISLPPFSCRTHA